MADPFEEHCWRDVVDQHTLDIYQPYRRDTSIGPKPALPAVDLYADVMRLDEVKRHLAGAAGGIA